MPASPATRTVAPLPAARASSAPELRELACASDEHVARANHHPVSIALRTALTGSIDIAPA